MVYDRSVTFKNSVKKGNNKVKGTNKIFANLQT